VKALFGVLNAGSEGLAMYARHAALLALDFLALVIIMGTMIIHMRIMPESIEADIEKLSQAVKEKITSEAPVDDVKLSITDVAFGLKAVNAYFVIDESFSGFDALEEKLQGIEGVSSTEIVDMRRALG